MNRTFLYIGIFLTVALGGGFASFDYMTRIYGGFDTLTLGVWQASPDMGTENQDIYSRAHAVRLGYISIGKGEGLVFQAWTDENHKALNPACSYELFGQVPEARFFTLYAVAHDGTPLNGTDDLPTKLYSRTLLFKDNGAISIRISPQAQSGNWLAVSGREPYGLILTLYNTSAARVSGLKALSMPSLKMIKQAGTNCD